MKFYLLLLILHMLFIKNKIILEKKIAKKTNLAILTYITIEESKIKLNL